MNGANFQSIGRVEVPRRLSNAMARLLFRFWRAEGTTELGKSTRMSVSREVGSKVFQNFSHHNEHRVQNAHDDGIRGPVSHVDGDSDEAEPTFWF